MSIAKNNIKGMQNIIVLIIAFKSMLQYFMDIIIMNPAAQIVEKSIIREVFWAVDAWLESINIANRLIIYLIVIYLFFPAL